jgi:hypothetical protein
MGSLIPTSDVNGLVFIAAGFAGMVSHFFKKKIKGETNATLVSWFTHNNPQASMYTIGAFSFAMFSALNTGMITNQMTVWNVIYAGLTTGFAIDSGFNNDDSSK